MSQSRKIRRDVFERIYAKTVNSGTCPFCRKNKIMKRQNTLDDSESYYCGNCKTILLVLKEGQR